MFLRLSPASAQTRGVGQAGSVMCRCCTCKHKGIPTQQKGRSPSLVGWLCIQNQGTSSPLHNQAQPQPAGFAACIILSACGLILCDVLVDTACRHGFGVGLRKVRAHHAKSLANPHYQVLRSNCVSGHRDFPMPKQICSLEAKSPIRFGMHQEGSFVFVLYLGSCVAYTAPRV